MRDLGLQLLSKVVKNSENCKLLEKNIFERTVEDTYLWCVYQISGMILQNHKKLKEISEQIKRGEIGWDSPIYHDIKKRIEEHDDYLVNPFEVVDGVTECPKCKSRKTWSVQKQTRSSDEPMTTFSKCVQCDYQWAYAG
jgi:DNA-directed RNA polymerase subunit M/transcription elongation factor TFIIS